MSEKCEECGEKYTDIWGKWCKPCSIDYIETYFTNQISGNKKVDDLIEEMRLKIIHYSDIIFEWIPHNQFYDIEEISKGDFATVYSAIWRDGPLYYNKRNDYNKHNYFNDYNKHNGEYYIRKPGKKVTLKCLHNSQNNISEILNEV